MNIIALSKHQLFLLKAPLLPCANCTLLLYTLTFHLFLPKHIFVLHRILFAQALAIAPHLSLGGLSRMVYEHLLGCFKPEDASSRFSKLFQVVDVVACGDIPRLVALMLGGNILLTMA